MTITFYSVLFCAKDSNGDLKSFQGFTSDEKLVQRIIKITGTDVESSDIRLRWAASLDPEYAGEAKDVEDMKQKIGGEVEETATGCWSTPGCKCYHMISLYIQTY
jgi:hypothetical protein